MQPPASGPAYYLFKFHTSQPQVLMAFLGSYPFEAFEEGEVLTGYLHEQYPHREVAASIREEFGLYFDHLEIELLPPQNWNAVWESNFEPVSIGDFCYVRASFHEPVEGVQHEIVIDPKMAFGTGHHATTWMMIHAMKSLQVQDWTVLDMGCGTGVLAILAARMGAAQVIAIDNDAAAVDNTKENLVQNDVAAEVLLGSASRIPDDPFDLILANINRGVLIEIMPVLARSLAPEGNLLLSGVLTSDQELMQDLLAENGLHVVHAYRRGEWLCLHARR
ncbi:MAG: 50S ribosomal protein L11 methyltransferase [Saprospiraceae bacterium]|nr:50S ribosomal protein L11 methyltransferase [Saprospiraceae bacterium]